MCVCVEEGVADNEKVAEGVAEGLTERVADDEGVAESVVEGKHCNNREHP